MSQDLRAIVEEYIKESFLNPPASIIEKHGGFVPSEEDWKRTPQDIKDFYIDLVIKYKRGDAMELIMAKYRKK